MVNEPSVFNSIVPFEHINGIIPGLTDMAAVLAVFGAARSIKGMRDGSFLHSYPNFGIYIIAYPDDHNIKSRIDAVYVEFPFDAITPNGLYIGQPKDEVLAICSKEWHLGWHYEESRTYAPKKGAYDSFQIWFEDGELLRMKIFPEKENTETVKVD